MRRQTRIGVTAIVLLLIADQLSKWWILQVVMQPPRRIPVLPFFDLVLAWNRGISFGLFDSDSAANAWILSAIALAIVAVLLVWLRRAASTSTGLALGFIIGGALGNVVDRLRFGAVVDFLDLHYGTFHWPAFNVADAAITVGAVLLVAESLFSRGEKGGKINDS